MFKWILDLTLRYYSYVSMNSTATHTADNHIWVSGYVRLYYLFPKNVTYILF